MLDAQSSKVFDKNFLRVMAKKRIISTRGETVKQIKIYLTAAIMREKKRPSSEKGKGEKGGNLNRTRVTWTKRYGYRYRNKLARLRSSPPEMPRRNYINFQNIHPPRIERHRETGCSRFSSETSAYQSRRDRSRIFHNPGGRRDFSRCIPERRLPDATPRQRPLFRRRLPLDYV